MKDTLSTLKNLLRAVRYLGATDALSWPGRGAAIWQVLSKLAAGGATAAGIPFNDKLLVFDLAHASDWYVYRGVFVRKEYATHYAGSVVVDIGAHRGLYAAFALRNGCAALLAYEPEPVNFSFLEENAERFTMPGQRVSVHPQAVGSRQGKARFFTYDQSWSHSLLERTDKDPVAELEVEQVSFERILARAATVAEGHRRVIVKVDAEGAEYDLVLNTPPRALTTIDELFLEAHSYAPGERDVLTERLATCGLTCSAPRRSQGPDRHALLHFTRAPRPEGERASVPATPSAEG